MTACPARRATSRKRARGRGSSARRQRTRPVGENRLAVTFFQPASVLRWSTTRAPAAHVPARPSNRTSRRDRRVARRATVRAGAVPAVLPGGAGAGGAEVLVLGGDGGGDGGGAVGGAAGGA